MLLDGACYHMADVFLDKNGDQSFWNKCLDRKASSKDFRDFLQGNGYRAGTDYPISFFYK